MFRFIAKSVSGTGEFINFNLKHLTSSSRTIKSGINRNLYLSDFNPACDATYEEGNMFHHCCAPQPIFSLLIRVGSPFPLASLDVPFPYPKFASKLIQSTKVRYDANN